MKRTLIKSDCYEMLQKKSTWFFAHNKTQLVYNQTYLRLKKSVARSCLSIALHYGSYNYHNVKQWKGKNLQQISLTSSTMSGYKLNVSYYEQYIPLLFGHLMFLFCSEIFPNNKGIYYIYIYTEIHLTQKA